MPSMKPLMLVMGVRSSWAMLPMKLAREESMVSRLRAMLLKVTASWATSSLPSTGTRTLKSPLPNLRAASLMRRSGVVSRLVTKMARRLAASSSSPALSTKMENMSLTNTFRLAALVEANT